MKSNRTLRSSAKVSPGRTTFTQIPITNFFPALRSPVQIHLASSIQSPIASVLSPLEVNSSSSKLVTTQQLSIKQFITVPGTPPDSSVQCNTPGAPQKTVVNIASRETVQPCFLAFSKEELQHEPIVFTQRSSKVQLQITSFFKKVWQITTSTSFVSQLEVATPHAPPVNIGTEPRRSRRSLLRRHLLQYKYNHSKSYRPIHSFPTFAPLDAMLYDSWGHSLPIIDSTKVFRVFLQNPNGLRLSGSTLPLQQDLRTCSEYGAAAICLPEANLNWNIPSTRDLFSSLLRKTWRNSAYSTLQPPKEFLSNRQPGGTATVICDNWTSRIIERGADPLCLGRWSYITLRGKGTTKVTIVSAYNATSSQGDTTNYQQQLRSLSRLHREHNQKVTVNPRRQFILDLQGWLEIKLLEGHKIVLGVDANDSYNPDTTGTPTPLEYNPDRPTVSASHNGKLSTLVASCGLKDPLALQHSSRPFPASHIRGSKRIDFILVTPHLQPAVLNSGSLAFHSLFHSDHRAYYVDFDTLLMFADPAHDIAPPSYRRLQLSDPRLINKYRDILHEQLNYHKIYEKVQTLQEASDTGAWTSATTEEYQKIDKLVTESML
jgi:exonuclease III